MRKLGTIDANNYSQFNKEDTRIACRAIVIKDGKILMVHSKKKGYYKFPGGGLEENESFETCALRELQEESGYIGNPSSVKEYGEVTEIRTSKIYNDCKFIHISKYFFIDLTGEYVGPKLENYEKELEYVNVFKNVDEIIEGNNEYLKIKKAICNITRENYVLNLLKKEGYLK